jgi:hypothetical protein
MEKKFKKEPSLYGVFYSINPNFGLYGPCRIKGVEKNWKAPGEI